jgi:histidyl-tRNA synthetase
VGFGLGLDRLCLLLRESGQTFGGRPELFVAVAEEAASDAALELVSRLRRAHLWVEHDPRGGSLKSQMKRADKTGARYALVLGGRELAENAAELKPMAGGEVRKISLDALESELRASAEK